MSPPNGAGLSPEDLAIDQQIAQLSGAMRFLLEVTPLNADDARDRFLSGADEEPVFRYRELTLDPDVADAALEKIDLGSVQDPTLGHLLRAKPRSTDEPWVWAGVVTQKCLSDQEE